MARSRLWKTSAAVMRSVRNAPRHDACPGLLRTRWPCLAGGCIEGDRRADQRLEGTRIDLLSLVDIDRAPHVPVEARVEEPGGIFQGRPLREGQLHYRLVGFAGADDPVMRPHGRA